MAEINERQKNWSLPDDEVQAKWDRIFSPKGGSEDKDENLDSRIENMKSKPRKVNTLLITSKSKVKRVEREKKR